MSLGLSSIGCCIDLPLEFAPISLLMDFSPLHSWSKAFTMALASYVRAPNSHTHYDQHIKLHQIGACS